MLKLLTTAEEIDRILAEKPQAVFYKHSTRCNISADAKVVVDQFAEQFEDDIFHVNVIESRSASDHLETVSGVQHASPQLLIFKNGKAVAHESHWRITLDYLSEKLD
jgi:bacillithiol system protein YtxJ